MVALTSPAVLACLVGASSSFLLSLVLLRVRGKDPLPARRLALLAFDLSFISAMAFAIPALWPAWRGHPVYALAHALHLLPTAAIGPLLYLYVAAEIDPLHGLGGRIRLHLVAPLSVGLVEALDRYLSLTGRGLAFELPSILANVGFIAAYMILSLAALSRHLRASKESHSSAGRLSLAWIRNVIYSSLSVPALYLGLVALRRIRPDLKFELLDEPGLAALDLGMLVLLAFLYYGITQPDTLLREEKAAEEETEKYRGSPFGPGELALLEGRLDELMRTKRPYLEAELSLARVAELVATPPRYVSQVINQNKGMNFYSYVNRFRLEEAQKRLAADSDAGILDIALDSGFSSKSSFNAVFKELTGTTPSAYRNRTRGEAEKTS